MGIEMFRELGVEPMLAKSRLGFVDTEVIENELVVRCERRFGEVHGLPAGWVAAGVSNGTDARRWASGMAMR